MKLELNRFISSEDETLGHLSIDGQHFCFILEDEYREIKLANETRIPAGTYKIIVRNSGGMNKRYREKYKSKHKGMLWLQNVPGFEWVYIHVGNTDEHTSGCLLTGYGCRTPLAGPWSVINSTDAYLTLATAIYTAIDNEERVIIEITDGDR